MRFYTSVARLGNHILYRGYSNGKRVKERIPYKPYIFIPQGKENTTGLYRTLDGRIVGKMQFETMRDARDFIQKYEEISNFEMFGLTNWEYTYINDQWKDEVEFDPSLIRIMTVDIEVESEYGFANVENPKERINAITVKQGDTIISIGLQDFVAPPKVQYVKCATETELLQKFVEIWNILDPDIVTGWYCRFFDIPYLYNRIRGLLGEQVAQRLSPFGKVIEKETTFGGHSQKEFEIVGISILDYMDVYKKFSFKNQDSYKLDNIAHKELGERKIDYSEHLTLRDLYKKDYQKYLEYNIHDVILVDKLEAKMKFLEMIVYIAYLCKVNYNDTFKQTRMWDSLIHSHLMRKNLVVPFRKRTDKTGSYAGAFVKEATPGRHKWVVSFDLNSLYPHLIIQYNIGPETLVEKMHRNFSLDEVLNEAIKNETPDYSMAANGYFFRKDKKSFLAELMQKLYDDRTISKKKMIEAEKEFEKTKNKKFEYEAAGHHTKQQALKITLNSAYGAIGNQHFRFYDIRLAEAVTISGQLSINWIAKHLNSFMNKACNTLDWDYVLAIDTDSVYLSCDGLVTKTDRKEALGQLETIMDKVVEPFIDKQYAKLSDIMGSYAQSMQMKREVVADNGIWTAKKRYLLNVLWKEGVYYKVPKVKIVGLESQRSSTPAWVRKRIENVSKIALQKDEKELQHYVSLVRAKFRKLPFDQVAYPRGVNELTKYADRNTLYKSGTPIHVRAALLYNDLLNKLNLTDKYPYIRNGDKIKFCYLKTPNPIHENVIGALDWLPPEFQLDDYIDNEEQFTKSFLDPINAIMEVIGWESEKTATLDEFFSYE